MVINNDPLTCAGRLGVGNSVKAMFTVVLILYYTLYYRPLRGIIVPVTRFVMGSPMAQLQWTVCTITALQLRPLEQQLLAT